MNINQVGLSKYLPGPTNPNLTRRVLGRLNGSLGQGGSKFSGMFRVSGWPRVQLDPPELKLKKKKKNTHTHTHTLKNTKTTTYYGSVKQI